MAHTIFYTGVVLAVIGFLAWIAAVIMTAVAATQTPPDTTLLWATFGVNLGGFLFAVVGLCMMGYALRKFWYWYRYGSTNQYYGHHTRGAYPATYYYGYGGDKGNGSMAYYGGKGAASGRTAYYGGSMRGGGGGYSYK